MYSLIKCTNTPLSAIHIFCLTRAVTLSHSNQSLLLNIPSVTNISLRNMISATFACKKILVTTSFSKICPLPFFNSAIKFFKRMVLTNICSFLLFSLFYQSMHIRLSHHHPIKTAHANVSNDLHKLNL